ncbi:MAG: APC family permease [Thermoanaerobaculia bacterium]
MEDRPETRELRRAMGFGDVTLFFITAVLSLRWLGTAAAAGASSILIWIVALITFFLPLAFTVIELSSRFPDEGGLYVWTREAFGELAGFITGWTYWASNLVYFPALLYFSAEAAIYIGGWEGLAKNRIYFVIASIAGLVIAAGLNIVGLDIGKWLHNVAAIATWLPIAVLLAGGAVAWAHHGGSGQFEIHRFIPSRGWKDVVFWSTIAFAFAGLESASLMGGEIRNASRVVPRAIVLSGTLITVVYILGTAAIIVALPGQDISSLAGFMQAIASISTQLHVPGIVPFVALLIAVSGVGGVGAWLAATARLPFVAGIDHVLPDAFGRLHPRWKTPWIALLTQTGLAAVFVVLGQAGTSVRGAYDVLVSLGVISYFIPFLFMFAAMIRHQRTRPAAGVLHVPGGKPVALVFAWLGLATTAISIALAMIPSADEPNPRLALLKIIGSTLVLLGVGLALYASGRRSARERSQP